MKKGKLILGSCIFTINFNENPTIVIEEINVDETKQLTSRSKWNPFKFNIVGDNKFEGKYEFVDSVFIIPDNETYIWKLHKCKINLDLNEITFERCEHVD